MKVEKDINVNNKKVIKNNIITKLIDNFSYRNNNSPKTNNYIINKNNSKNANNGMVSNKNNKEIKNRINFANQNKKNSFRAKQKLGDKLQFKNNSNLNNIQLNSFLNNKNSNFYLNSNTKYPIKNKNNEKDFPLSFSIANTTKQKLSNKAQIKYDDT